MQNIENAVVSKEILEDVIRNLNYNKTIIDYYEFFSQNSGGITFNMKTLEGNTKRLRSCNRLWSIDKYEEQKIKDFVGTNLCRDKFCANCKKVRQAARMAKYIPVLETYKDRLFHLTLTLPNVPGEDLIYTYKKMAKSFNMLVRYLDGRKKIKEIDFSSWGYEGAVRSLEVTFKGDSYHPHFHVGLVLNPNILSKKHITNTFSYDYKTGIAELKRLFSKEEILIQKIWYLLINDKKVNKANIDGIKTIRKELNEKNIESIGYSCTIDKFKEQDFAELFKYMTKEKDENGDLLTYENFVALYFGLYRVKQIQGYGCLYSVTDEIDLEEYEEKYIEFIDSIRKKEDPERVYQKPQDLVLDNQYKLISRKSYFKYLREL